jgi:tetratricopeptide (TPR) repeat protein
MKQKVRILRKGAVLLFLIGMTVVASFADSARVADSSRAGNQVREYFKMNRIEILITILVGIITILFSTLLINFLKKLDPSSPKNKLNNALKKGYTVRAIEELTNILKDSRGKDCTITHKALGDRADVFLNIRDFNSAIKDANECISINKDNNDAYFTLGMAYSLTGKGDIAIINFNEALRLQTKNKEKAYFYLGIEYFIKGEYEKAIDNFNKALLEIKPTLFLGFIYRAIAYFRLKKYDLTIDDCNTLLKMNLESDKVRHKLREMKPEQDLIYILRGHAFMEKNNYDQAISDYSKAIENKYRNALYYSFRGNAFFKKGKYTSALKD